MTDLYSGVFSPGVLRFIHRLIRTLILPNNAADDDAAIIIGPDLPTCMQATYAAAIFQRSEDSTLPGHASKFWAVQRNTAGLEDSSAFDEGYYFTDSGGACGYIVTRTEFITNDTGLNQLTHFQQFGITTASGTVPEAVADRGVNYTWQLSSLGIATRTSQLTFASATGDDIVGISEAHWRIDGTEQGRGIIAGAAAQSNSGAIGAETQVLTPLTVLGSGNVTYKDGRAYLFMYGARFTGSVVNTVVVRFRHTNTAGAEILAFSHPLTAATQWFSGANISVNDSGSDITHTSCFSIGATAGTATMNGAATIPRYALIFDIGSADDYSNFGFPTIPA